MTRKIFVRTASFLVSAFLLASLMHSPLQAQPRRATTLPPTHALKRIQSFSGAEQVSLAAFMQNYRATFGLSTQDELKPEEVLTDELGVTHHRMQQFYRGLAVADQSFLVHEKAGEVYLAHGELAPGLRLEVKPALTESQALRFALEHVGAQSYMWENSENETFLQREQNEANATFKPKGELMISAPHEARSANDFRLAYRFDIYAEQPLGRYHVDVDAHTGAIVKVTALLHDADLPGQGTSVYNGHVDFTADQVNAFSYRLRQTGRGKGIETYDMKRGTNLNNAVDFLNPDTNFISANAQAGVSVHWALEGTYDYYKRVHNRDSFDNRGGKLLAYVHVDNGWFNATWDNNRMFFGDGINNAEQLVTIDIVAHEMTHGVTGNSARLIYASESGALNESFSDIFGTAVEFAMLGASGSWRLSEGAVAARLQRSMSNPQAFGDPDTYLGGGWASTAPGSADNGGVHTNSGVQNFWFYLLSEGGSGVNDNGDAYNVPALGLAQAEQMAYRNLTRYLTQSSGYFEARLATIYSTIDLYGADSPQYDAALAAWNAVGVYYPNLAATLAAEVDTLGFLAEAAVARDTSTVLITNRGLADLTLSNFQISDAAFELLGAPSSATLNYGSSATLRVLFKPTSASVTFGALTMTSSDPQRPTHTIALRGKGFAIRPASASLIYANAGRASQGVIFTVNPGSGAGAAFGKTNYDELTGLALRPGDHVIYGTIATSLATQLVRVDAQTGEAYARVTVPLANMRAIVFDRDNALYGAHFNTGKIYRVDLATGDTTLLVHSKLTLISGMAINPNDSSLWATRASGQSIYKIDKKTGATTVVGASGVNQIADLEFDAAGHLFGLAGFGQNVVSDFVQINPATGKAVKIGSTGFKSAFSLIMRGEAVTAVAEPAEETTAPKIFALSQNHPNPILSGAKSRSAGNPATAIKFYLPVAAHATLKVFDLAGREVATLVDGAMKPGEHQARFDASALAAGVYLYRLQAGARVATRKLLLVK